MSLVNLDDQPSMLAETDVLIDQLREVIVRLPQEQSHLFRCQGLKVVPVFHFIPTVFLTQISVVIFN
jgi:hypothetical protein